jgi:hypothetical protein
LPQENPIKYEKAQEKPVPNYRKPLRPSEHPNFQGINFEKKAESIIKALEQIDKLIIYTEDELDSTHRNLLLNILIGIKSSLLDEYSRLEHPEWYKGTPEFGTDKLHPATIDRLNKALSSWGLEIRNQGE